MNLKSKTFFSQGMSSLARPVMGTIFLVIDNFKGQLTSKVNSILEANNSHVCLLPHNTTDELQPLDISVNKPAKDFLRDKFQEWYVEKVMDQIDANADPDDVDIDPICLSMPVLKQMMVEMSGYISDNPQIIVNGFIRAGISGFLDNPNADQCETCNSSEDEGSSSDDNNSCGDDEMWEEQLELERSKEEREGEELERSEKEEEIGNEREK